ncbi:hypothetical protein [Flavobacterium sp.]|uniref:hypothetical protein n=1 Tax=Flavobacterium sp. TaxID=239 RepID=UPI00286E8022|nr:hypothetical protein [Flavobacterium sp.]
MKNFTHIKTYKISNLILGISLVSILGLSLVIFKNIKDTEKKLKLEKQVLILSLTKSKDSLSIVINENTSIKTDLLVEQQKIVNLINEVNSSSTSIEQLAIYRNEVVKLRKQVSVLKKEKLEIASNYHSLKRKQDSTTYVLENSKKSFDELKAQNNDMSRKIIKSSKISLVNLKTETLKNGLSGSFATDKASKVNALKVSFMVVGNKLAKSCQKQYYVQIIDSNNNVIGEKRSVKFGPMILDYSYSSTFEFENENLEVSSDLEIQNPEKGMYFVNIFDKENLALKTSFVLR